MKRLALIDADIPLYHVCSAVEHPVDWGNDIWTLHADFLEAAQLFDNTVADLKDMAMADKVVLCFSGSCNWRMDVLPSYKAHRASNRKPVVYVPLKEYACSRYDCVIHPNLEADDCLGIIATGPKSRWRNCSVVVMLSEDKDLLTVPGTLLNPRTAETTVISKELANYNHLYQTLVGDAVDNYKGCPGVGPVSAHTLLRAEPTWDTVVAAYAKAGLSEEDALIQARVARILRHREYNTKTQEVKLWKPSHGQRSRIRVSEKLSTRDLVETPELAKAGST
jgi:DNA polymerase-1